MKRSIIATFVLVVIVASGVLAANPADLTSDYRICPYFYSKVAYDDGPWYGLQIVPLGKKASLTFNKWSDETGRTVENQAILSASVSPKLDIALDAEKWKGASDCTDLILDYHPGKLGLGARLPLLGGKPTLGPRASCGNFTAYATLPSDGGSRFYGLTHLKNNLEVDLAYGNGTTFLRASYWRGNVVPEIRLRWTNEESRIGIALAYYPH